MLDAAAIASISEICRRRRVRELLLFGSAVRNELRPDSDIDVLVDFEPDARPGFLTLAKLAGELSAVLHRQVDVVPKGGLKPLIRDAVLSETKVLFAA